MNSLHALSHNRTKAGYRCPHFAAIASNAARAAASLTAV